MDKDALALLLMECLVFVFKIERAKGHLVQWLINRDMDESAVESFLEARGQTLRLKVLKATVTMVVAGFVLSKLLNESSISPNIGRVGAWVMYVGLVLGALQFKGANDSAPSGRSIRNMFKK